MAKILIVDDSSLARRILRKALKPTGHQIVEAADGMTAIEQYSLHRPDLVMLDMTMPGMHGLEVLKKLREMDDQARVIVATADIQSSTRTLVEEAGAIGYINKPFVAEQVLGAVDAALTKVEMMLTERQEDALVELVNIAFGRAGAALSQLTGQRVILEAPRVEVCPLDALRDVLGNLVGDELATVHQIFMGPLAGDAFLALGYEDAIRLVDLLTGEYTPPGRFSASAREVLTEVGNILLNACLGMFGNLLQVQISFAVPRVRLEDFDSLLASFTINSGKLRYALVVYMRFRLQDSAVRGYLVTVLSVTSLEQLMQAVERWAKAEGGE